MARWDVIVHCLPLDRYFRVGSIEAETFEDALKIHATQFRSYLSENTPRGISPGTDIPGLDKKE